MSDNEDPLLAIIVGADFGAVIIILGFRYIIVRCDKTKKNNNASSSTVKVIPSKSLSTSVVPQKIKLRRKVTHDPSNTEPRKIIERIRIGIELIFKEFDQSRNGLIDPEEVRKCKDHQVTPQKQRSTHSIKAEESGGPECCATTGTVQERFWPLLSPLFLIFLFFFLPRSILPRSLSLFLLFSSKHLSSRLRHGPK